MNQYVSYRNLRFLLHEVLNASSVLKKYDYYQDYDQEAYDMAMDAVKQIADTQLFPYLKEMDRYKVTVADGTVHVHPQLKNVIQSLAQGGWIAAHASYEKGGSQMPLVLMNSGLFSLYSANINTAYAFLTTGAANLISTFGSEALQAAFVPEMYSGNWQGTMALTEPQAGSSLSDVVTSAELREDGSYAIKGQKIYISGGDHDCVENVVHLLLARIKGAPAGTKGISLFVVPKKRLEDGAYRSNDVTTAGVYGKMGQKNYVAAHLMFGEKDDCQGYLVGQEHKGLSYMFQMMNEARIGTGLMATGNASAAFYASLKYANERPQGRHPSNKDASQPQVLIIEHADVKRMLLFQKSVVEGSIALLLQCSLYADLVHVGDAETKEKCHLLLELLTPIVKSFPSEYGIQSVKVAMQSLGGAGYCDDFPIEQHYREIPINSIYEGTTAIHGMDLLGRKVMLEKGKAMQLFAKEVMKTIGEAQTHEGLKPFGDKLGLVAQKLQQCTQHLIGLAMSERAEVFLADATLYLEYFSLVTIGWQWLVQGIVAQNALATAANEDETNFYQGKIHTLRYYFEYEIPKTRGLHERLISSDRLTTEMKGAYIN
jgi:alkylation response protein AidB-like acyl-CoA dehydrogenase